MKRLIFILLFLPIFGFSQIIVKPDSVLRNVGFKWQIVNVFTKFMTEAIPVSQDSIIYSFGSIPKEAYERFVKHGFEQIGDTIYKYTKRGKIDLTYARRLILYQFVEKFIYDTIPKNEGEKMFFYIKKAKELGLNSQQFYNYSGVQQIISKQDSIVIK